MYVKLVYGAVSPALETLTNLILHLQKQNARMVSDDTQGFSIRIEK